MSFGPNLTQENRPVHERVILAVADANGVDHTELDPLYETIDPDALDALFKPGVDGTITFHYEGHRVAVRSDGTATVDGVLVDGNTTQTFGISDESGTGRTGQ